MSGSNRTLLHRGKTHGSDRPSHRHAGQSSPYGHSIRVAGRRVLPTSTPALYPVPATFRTTGVMPMRKDLMEILACPMCKSELTLTIDEEKDDEVIRGTLYCAKCDERYPIEDSIPNLLPPDLRKQMSAT
jgi:uncharacterized protein